jgi:hypothetical protein
VRSLSVIDELLNEIGQDHHSATLQMDAVSVKTPAIQAGNLVDTSAQHKNAERTAIEGRNQKDVKVRPREPATCWCRRL